MRVPLITDANPLTRSAREDFRSHLAHCPACVTDDALDLCLNGSDLFAALEAQVALDRAFEAVDAFLATLDGHRRQLGHRA